jgi:RNA polymerase primary sigma factor
MPREGREMVASAGYQPDDALLRIYFREVGKYSPLPREEELRLARKAKGGDGRALERLVRSNLRFVIRVAKKYQNRGLSLSDLIAEGNMGLMRAALKFDDRKNIKFISYAIWWIRQAILQALAEQSRLFRVPLNRADLFHKLSKQSSLLAQQIGREPTDEEMAKEMGLPLDEIDSLLVLTKSTLSLDAPVAAGDESELRNYIPDEIHPNPEQVVFEKMRAKAIDRALAQLSPREARILRFYYGLNSEDFHTLEEIGKIEGITRERVRQIKKHALKKLKQRSRAEMLRSFLE